MKQIIGESYEAMSAQAADALLRLVQPIKNPVICVASGSSPIGLYRHFVRQIRGTGIDISGWYFVGLDEWSGMNGEDEGSCRHMLNEHLFHPLQVKEEQLCFFNGRAGDLVEECRRVEAFIQQHGGIDVAIVGIGLNGHIGMNEPGTPVTSRSHVATLHPTTQEIGQKYFSQPRQLDTGVTLGPATLLEATHIFLIANGAHKADIIHRMLTEEKSEVLPATCLRDHAETWVFLDKDAAASIQ